jgi:hypothetical protein
MTGVLVIVDTHKPLHVHFVEGKRGVGENVATAQTSLCMATEGNHSSLGRYCQDNFRLPRSRYPRIPAAQPLSSDIHIVVVLSMSYSIRFSHATRLLAPEKPMPRSMPGERNIHRQTSSSPPRLPP